LKSLLLVIFPNTACNSVRAYSLFTYRYCQLVSPVLSICAVCFIMWLVTFSMTFCPPPLHQICIIDTLEK